MYQGLEILTDVAYSPSTAGTFLWHQVVKYILDITVFPVRALTGDIKTKQELY